MLFERMLIMTPMLKDTPFWKIILVETDEFAIKDISIYQLFIAILLVNGIQRNTDNTESERIANDDDDDLEVKNCS